MQLSNCFSLQNKRFLVTGAASGIGAATAELLVAAGARVVTADLNEVAPQCRGEKSLRLDLGIEASCLETMQETVAVLGGLDGLVHCAAMIRREDIDDVSEHSMQRQFAVNMAGPFHLCRAARPLLAQGGDGRIVLFTSQGAHTGGYVGSTVYAMTKAAVIALGKSLARQWATEGIRVNMISPGAADTPMLRDGTSSAALDAFLKLAPLGRAGTPFEVAACAAFLLSPAAAYVTGHTLDVNGGMLMR